MYEPKLLARLDSIKHHLMAGMDIPYVIDEIEGLQRDIEREMRCRQGYELKGVFTKTEDIYFDPPLQFDSRHYPMDAKVIKTPQSSRFEWDIYRSKDGWVCQLKIEPHLTYGQKGPQGVHGYTPPKSNCPEYVEGPPPTWRRDELMKWQYPQGED